MGSFAGVINVNKEKGYTSFDVVAILRRLYSVKAGHTGTLDPNATGVLPICLGKATKFSEYFMDGIKKYTAEVVLGVTTTTGDITGEVLTRHTKDASFPDKQEISAAVMTFLGKQEQVPPMYSAIKIGGQKLYDLARAGKTVHREARPIEIYAIDVFAFQERSFWINVSCSKGTYIRSLCTDIGEKLGTGATMGELVRTGSGPFFIETAYPIGEIKGTANIWSLVKPLEELLPYPVAQIEPAYVKNARNGNALKLSNLLSYDTQAKKHWLKNGDEVIGLFRKESGLLKCEVML